MGRSAVAAAVVDHRDKQKDAASVDRQRLLTTMPSRASLSLSTPFPSAAKPTASYYSLPISIARLPLSDFSSRVECLV